VPLGFSTKSLFEIALQVLSVLLASLGGNRVWRLCGRVPRLDACSDGAAELAARLTFGVELRLGVGFSLNLFEVSTLAKWRAGLAASIFADPIARMGELPLFHLGEGRFDGSPVRGLARIVTLWWLGIRILAHRGTKYRRVRSETLPMVDIDGAALIKQIAHAARWRG
jgi:hypothetical protein